LASSCPAPHPNPLRASFARLDPAQSGERELKPAPLVYVVISEALIEQAEEEEPGML